MAELTSKQKMFCREYLVDLNATKAAERAGYSVKTAYSIGQENLKKPDIQNRIQKLMREREEQLGVDAKYVLGRLVAIDQMDALDILNDDGAPKPLSQWPKIWRQFISGFDVASLKFKTTDSVEGMVSKIKWPDKIKNLELLGKHVEVQAFKDKAELDVRFGVADEIRKAREAREAKK